MMSSTKHPTKQERTMNAILEAASKGYPTAYTSRELQDLIYEKLKHATPNTSAIGSLCRVLSSRGRLIRHQSGTMSPNYTYSFNPEASE